MVAGGAVCNTSSVAGMLAMPFLAAYAAAKAVVISYTRTLARTWERKESGSTKPGADHFNIECLWQKSLASLAVSDGSSNIG
jgi:NAD(P)-dependent dehydrogenase (short-subunit alcohol dehydrogenase family)